MSESRLKTGENNSKVKRDIKETPHFSEQKHFTFLFNKKCFCELWRGCHVIK